MLNIPICLNSQENVGQGKVLKKDIAKAAPLNSASLKNSLSVIQKTGMSVVETKQLCLSTVSKRNTRTGKVNNKYPYTPVTISWLLVRVKVYPTPLTIVSPSFFSSAFWESDVIPLNCL